MTATNHALTGSIIGLTIHNPWLALPAAVVSHFVCDALPHFGNNKYFTGSAAFARLLLADAILCGLLVLSLSIFQPKYWLLAVACALFAASPDFMWINQFRRARAGLGEPQQKPVLLKFHAAIQWFERPIGAVVEAAWATGALILLKLYIV